MKLFKLFVLHQFLVGISIISFLSFLSMIIVAKFLDPNNDCY